MHVKWSLAQTQKPTREPLSLDDAKLACRIDSSDFDDLITSLITTARRKCERTCRRSFLTQKYRMSLENFPFERTHSGFFFPDRRGPIYLSEGPVQSVDTFKYLDADTGVLTDVAGYQMDLDAVEATLIPAYDQSWPKARRRTINAVQITYTTGFGDTPDTVPDEIVTAMKLLIATWFTNPEAAVIGVMVSDLPLPATVDGLLDAYKVVSWS